MIIQTGLRTDIPAFYTPWFLNRLAAGYVLVRSPYRNDLVTKYRLSPDVVDVIGFCTKNPAPMLPHMDALAPYGQYWFVTITPYGRDIEPNVPDKERVMADFRILSALVGPQRVAWRYDPILLTEVYTVERHLTDFAGMCRNLEGATHTCVISFIDLYQKVKRNFPEIREVPKDIQLHLGREMAAIAQSHGIRLKTCHEGDFLAPYGVDCSGCMTLATYEEALGMRLAAPKQKPSSRGCACHLSCDIGAYNTCGHLCRYCYANDNAALVRSAMAGHDPDSPILTGRIGPNDIIHEAKQTSWRDGQLTLF